MASLPRILVVAGSDSGGGAGIQADIKTITALKGYTATAITALTAQNTQGVFGVMAVEPAFVVQQIRVVLEDIGADAIKTGMLLNASIIEACAGEFDRIGGAIPIVIDPVMVATSGARLLEDDAVQALIQRLIPQATVLTPNLPEAQALLGRTIAAPAEMIEAARELRAWGARSVLLKGGHLIGDRVVDVLVTPDGEEIFEDAKIRTTHTHGTGCTLASAIACGLARGATIRAAVMEARAFVRSAIATAPGFGQGNGPLNPYAQDRLALRNSGMTSRTTIRNEHLTAIIDAKGAELVSLIPTGGDEQMWSGDPDVWPWHAPNLFPIVGALADDMLVHEGRYYPMKQHGFLRHSQCERVSIEETACSFRLIDKEETRKQYPFAFALTPHYRIESDRLVITFELHNPASTPLHASLGAHPGFRWPLGGADRAAHRIVFEKPEHGPIRCLKDRMLAPETRPSPVRDRVLTLNDTLFAADALVFDQLASRRVTYGAPGGHGIEIDFSDFPFLGIWSKPGRAEFVCLEPWQGHASPVGYGGEFSRKPGVVTLQAGETRSWRYSIRPIGALPLA